MPKPPAWGEMCPVGLKASAAPLLPEVREALSPVKPSHVAAINDVVCK